MTVKIPQSLEGVSETLLITMLARARESQRPDGMIHDEAALDIVKQMDYDFSRIHMQRHDEVAIIIRMRKFDNFVRQFLRRNPQAAVVHIGCGLDTRFERVDDGRVEWFDLDMPDVMAMRQKLLHISNSRYHTLATSVFEQAWLEEVARCQPRALLFIAEGVLPYFEEAQVKELFLRLRDRFPGCELVSDVHTPFVVWADNIHLALIALAQHALGHTQMALASLQQALTLAEPEGYVRLFVDEGPAMVELLNIAISHNITPDYARKLLEAFPKYDLSAIQSAKEIAVGTHLLVESFSEREIEVLRLISEGYKYQEIAEKLVISINTVRYHTRNVYSKLGANNRTQAIGRAKELNIL